MENEPPIAPLGRTGVGDGFARSGEMCRRRGAKEAGDLGICGSRAVNRSGFTRRFIKRDAPAPRQGGLAVGQAVRVGQHISRHLIHQDERIKRHRLPRKFGRPDRLNHRPVGWRAAVKRAAIKFGNFHRRTSRHPRYRPRHPHAVMGLLFHLGAHFTGAAPQIAAKPRHHQ